TFARVRFARATRRHAARGASRVSARARPAPRLRHLLGPDARRSARPTAARKTRAGPLRRRRPGRASPRLRGLGRRPDHLLAARGAQRQPTIVYYHGYSGDRGTISSHLPWALQGYTVLAVDVRGQSGDSGDTSVYPAGHAPGYMTQGILSPRHYYYRGVYAD